MNQLQKCTCEIQPCPEHICYGFIIIVPDEWDELAIVLGYNGRPKLFKEALDAVRYTREMEIDKYQITEITF